MKTSRKPGKLTKADNIEIERWQKRNGIQADGKWGTQSTGQWIIERVTHEARISALEHRVKRLWWLIGALGLAGGAGVLGSM